MALRAFSVVMTFLIDEEQGDDQEDEEQREPAVSDFVREWLSSNLTLDIDTDDNPLGFQSGDVDWDSLKELPPKVMRDIYGD